MSNKFVQPTAKPPIDYIGVRKHQKASTTKSTIRRNGNGANAFFSVPKYAVDHKMKKAQTNSSDKISRPVRFRTY